MDTWSALPDASIPASDPFGSAFRSRGCTTLAEAGRYLCVLPYGRNADRADFRLVLVEGRGTCSTKHALLAALAQEIGAAVVLTLGIYEMSNANTPGVGVVLDRHGVSAIPEAHTYVRVAGRRIDITRSGVEALAPIDPFLLEQEISPDQIGDYKVSLHRLFMQDWLAHHPELARRFNADALRAIREECIAAISGG